MIEEGRARPSELRFCDLGPLSVQVNGRDRSPGGRRSAAALALLLMNANRRVSADALREAMWGDASADRSASTLETHVFRLRRVIEPDRRPGQPSSVLISESAGYRLVVAPDQVDSIRCTQLAADTVELLRSGQPARARRKTEEALALWRGQPYESVADEVWAAAPVAALEEVRTQLQESLVESLLGCNEPEAALRELEPMLAEHPLRERLWRHRMLAAYRCGRVDDALRAFQEARRLLLDELGLEPGPELRELQASILAGGDGLLARRRSPSTVAALEGPVNLPRRSGTLFGRSDDIAELREACVSHPLLTVTGPGGCGKTSLAVEAARTFGEEFVDGVWFVDLSSVEVADEVAGAVVSALGLPPASTGRPADQLRGFVRDRRMLLILDNCEHVVEAVADLVDTLLVPGAELAVLATSREPLQVRGERVLSLGPLSVPALEDDGSVGDLSDVALSPAVQLFLDRCQSEDPRQRSGAGQSEDHDLALVAQICRAVDGVPLAVELAAARVPAYSLAEIARQVVGDPASLGQVRRSTPAHQQNLRRTVEWSHRTLTPAERLVHRRVSIVPGPFTTAVAATLSGLEPGEVESALVGLLHKSMLVGQGPGRSGGPSRFAQLATIRAHGHHELTTLGEVEAVRQLRVRWMLDQIRVKPRPGHRDERGWFNVLEDDYACVRSALDDTLRLRRDPTGCSIAGRLNMFWYFHGLVPEAGRWFALARQVDGATALDQVLVTFGLAAERGLAQRMDVARPLIEDGLRIAGDRLPGQDVAFGDSLVQLAGGVYLAGDQVLAADLARRALWLAEQHDDALLALTARARLILSSAGDPAEAAAIYQQAREHQNHYAAYLAAIGAMLHAAAIGRPADGLEWSDRIIALNRRQDIGQAPVVLEVRANLLTLAGEPVEALRIYSAARYHNSRAGVPWPNRDATATLLARATSQVSRRQFDEAWQTGRHLAVADIAPIGGVVGAPPH